MYTFTTPCCTGIPSAEHVKRSALLLTGNQKAAAEALMATFEL